MNKKIKYNLLKDKRGVSMQGWSEALLLLIGFTLLIGIFVASMNSEYKQNKDPSFGIGINNNANKMLTNLTDYQNKMSEKFQTGTASFASVFGLTLSTSWEIVQFTFNLFSSLVTGGWILGAVSLMGLPLYLGTIFQLMYLIGLGYIVIKLLFRIKP
jgi:hypothetical protein